MGFAANTHLHYAVYIPHLDEIVIIKVGTFGLRQTEFSDGHMIDSIDTRKLLKENRDTIILDSWFE